MSYDCYNQENLTSDVGNTAIFTDPDIVNSRGIVNPWGIIVAKDGTLWVAVNHSNMLINLTKDGAIIRKVTTTGSPTGLVNSTLTNFNADLIVVTENGTVEVYRPLVNPNATIVVSTLAGNVYKGAAIQNNLLYVTDFTHQRIIILDSNFVLQTNTITDPALTAAGYSPFNVYSHNGRLYISFAKFNGGNDEVHGPGNGYIDSWKNGVLRRLVSRGPLNAPWGMLITNNSLWVGNFGNGLINIFTGSFDYSGNVTNCFGGELINDGLWGLAQGRGGRVYFAAGSDDETHGLVGVLKGKCKGEESYTECC